MQTLLLAFFLLISTVVGTTEAATTPSAADMVKMLATIDDRQQNSGDYSSLVFIEQKEKGKSDLVYQAQILRRDLTDKLVILFVKPQAEAGKGYLRLDNNMFFYDPSVGKWERRTERERIGGTGSQRSDFDQSRLTEEYTPVWVGAETLGRYNANRLKLTSKEGVDVAYPVVDLWIDAASGNTLKRVDYALSGRAMRTTLYPEWQKLYSASKKADVYFPKQIVILDEVEKGNTTTVVIQEVKLDSLEDSLFSKAWLESKSR